MPKAKRDVPVHSHSIRFEQPIYDALTAHCERNGVSVSEEVNQIVRFWLDGVLDPDAKGENA